tara:strand:+ start:389 stop:556 length:168 start_codon:yes stop_codon:yes gene_type:complete
MKTLTDEQARALVAFLESFDLVTTGVWAPIEEAMQEQFGIADPEEALADARAALE